MAYTQPGVTVTQNFIAAQPALAAFSLPNVIVGPAFQVVTQEAEGMYAAALAVFPYSGQIAGTYIDLRPANSADLTTYPVQIFLENPIVQLKTVTATGVILIGNLNQFTDPTGGAFSNLVAGDVITITNSSHGNNGAYTIRTVVSANVVQVNETFAAADTALSYTVTRNVNVQGSPLPIPTSTSGVIVAVAGVTLPAVLNTTVAPFGSVPILSATVLLSYRALRFDGSADLVAFDTIDELEGAYGTDQIVPENTAVFGAFVALSNSVTETNILELPETYLNTGGGSGDEVLAYSAAFDVLALNDIYAISVMTQNTAVHTVLRTHVDDYSMPAEMLERVGITNIALVTSAIVAVQAADGAVDSTGLVFTSASGEFITDDVVPGNFITITTPTPQAGSYEILSVDSQTQVHLYPVSQGGTIIPGGPVTGITFTVTENLSLDQQAATIAAFAASLGDRRMVLTWPDQVNIPSGNVVRTLPGYFLNCAVGALTTGLPTQQGFTNLSMALFTGLVHSTKYFSNAQMNVIAGGGVMIFVQAILDQTAVYIRHQLTTNTSSVFFQEYSITKNVDFVAKFIRTNHQKYIGQFNIVDGTFDALKTAAKGDINFLTENPLPMIGSVLNSGSLTSVIQNPTNPAGIQEQWAISIPVPLNNLDITLNIS